MDKFRFCACCSGAQDVNGENDIAGEWFCSTICENIEQACIELSNTINPIMPKNESLKLQKLRKNYQSGFRHKVCYYQERDIKKALQES
ncbi:hypothetical protein [Helicobacter sp.]|uniref:hypothetical protein n=1 Tax=Helicobacter sp. TaxID=218 RepID=UPI0025BBCEB7|nr:hypothetical protein [Helicobacter sp.]MBR2495118.1 hypothetical protein [Helicobacter sp.]